MAFVDMPISSASTTLSPKALSASEVIIDMKRGVLSGDNEVGQRIASLSKLLT